MSLQELIDSGQNITIAVKIDDLREFANLLVARTRCDLERAIIDDQTESYPNQKQVSQILGVSPSTLWRWNNIGYLQCAQVGKERRYKMSEVKTLLNLRTNKL